MKRLLSLVLALVMLVSVVPVGAFAAEAEDEEVIIEEVFDQPEIEPVEEPAEPVQEEVEEIVSPVVEEQEEEPAEVEPEEEPVVEQPSEEVTEEQPEETEETEELPEETEELPEETEAEVLPVKVEFLCAEGVVVSVFDAATDVQMAAEEDGSFLLVPGQYYYTAEQDGEVICDKLMFTVADEALQITVVGGTLTADPAEANASYVQNDKVGAWYDPTRHLLAVWKLEGEPENGTPWDAYAGEVHTLFFDEGVDTVGAGWFRNCSNIEKVLYKSTMPEINADNGKVAEIEPLKYAQSFTVDYPDVYDLSENGPKYPLNVTFNGGDYAVLTYDIVFGEDERDSDYGVAEVDAEGVIHFSGKTGTVYINVWDVLSDQVAELTVFVVNAVPDGYISYETRSLATMNDEFIPVTAKILGQPLPNNMIDLEVISGDAVSVIEHPDYGIGLKPEHAGTAVIHAFVKGEMSDVEGRDGQLTVQILGEVPVWFWTDGMQDNALWLDTSASEQYRLLEMFPEGSNEAVNPAAYTFSTSNAAVAKAALNKASGTVKLTVPKKASGSCTITATPVDKTRAKETVSMTVHVQDYTPKLSTNKITLNPKALYGEPITISSGYGNGITDVELLDETGRFWYGYNGLEGGNPAASVEVGIGIKDSTLKNQTIKTKLAVYTEHRPEPYEFDLTVTVKSVLPKVTLKQTRKANLFVLDESNCSEYTVTASGYYIGGEDSETQQELQPMEAVSLNASGWKLRDASRTYNGGVIICVEPLSHTPAKTGTLSVKVAGFAAPISVPISLATTNKKPTLAFAQPSITFNTANVADGSDDFSFVPPLFDKTEGNEHWLNEYTVTLPKPFISDGAGIVVPAELLNVAKKTTYKIPVTLMQEQWASPITLNYSMTIVPASVKPTVKLAKSSITINSRYLTDLRGYDDTSTVCVPFTVNQATEFDDVRLECSKREYEDCFGYSISWDNKLVIDLLKPVPAGSYTLTFTPVWQGQNLKPVKLTVKVIDKAITMTASAKGKLDIVQGSSSSMYYYLKVKNADFLPIMNYGGRVSLVSPAAKKANEEDGSNQFDMYVGYDDAKGPYVELRLKDTVKYDAKKTYKFRICADLNSEPVYTKDISLKLSQVKPKLSVFEQQNIVKQSLGSWKTEEQEDGTEYRYFDRWTTLSYTICDSGTTIASIEKVEVDWKAIEKNAALVQTVNKVEISKYNWEGFYPEVYVNIGISNADKLAAGKTYKVPVLVTVKGLAAPVKMNLSFKVQK